MIKQLNIDEFADRDFVPQAVFRPYANLSKDWRFERRHDDLDWYEGGVFSVGNVLFALRHYQGHPDNTFTIYLTDDIRDITRITDIIALIVREMPIPRDAIIWQRKDNPEY